MQRVLVIDGHSNPHALPSGAGAGTAAIHGKAAVYRRFPFTVILTD